MKNKIGLLGLFASLLGLTLIGSTNANAQATDGKEAAYKVCARMNFPSDANICLQTVSAAGHFSVDAIAIVNKYNTAADLNAGLTIIMNKFYQKTLLNVCARMNFASDGNICLTEVGDKVADDLAINVCNHQNTAADLISCLKTIVRVYIPTPDPTPTPLPTPLPPLPPLCQKAYVMSEFDSALSELGQNQLIQAYQRVFALKNYLLGCMQ